MSVLFKKYTNSKYMAQDIRRAMVCYFSKTAFDLMRKQPSKEDVEQYIAGLFDIEENRQLIFGKGKMVKVFATTLFGQTNGTNEHKDLFVNALMKHNKTIYQPLLTGI